MEPVFDMNRSDLDRMLKGAKTPARTPEYWEDFPRQVTIGLRPGVTTSVRHPAERRFNEGGPLRLAWKLGFALVCLATGFLVGHWHGSRPSQTVAATELLHNGKVIQEMLAMFPNQVRAVVQDERGINVVLSETNDVPASTPLWIRVSEGDRERSFVTFSGQSVQINQERVEVLQDAQGGIILVGDRFFWSSGEPGRALDHLRIQARALALNGGMPNA